ncbi:MAG: beta-ketoacyl-ACP reductase [Acidobacteria bacterium]|nr:MAG: beta-ketoacyl-ACP reductase [Acidobacteriota bacterium]
MLLKDRIVFITGGSQGIGRACALILAEAGAHIAIGSRNLEKQSAVVQEVEQLGRKSLAVKVDINDPVEIRAAFAKVLEQFGRIDVLVNNAGITKDTLLLRMKKEEWDSVLQTNLTGVFLCSQEAIRIMLKQRYGRIINIASVVGQSGNPGQANYVASKAGIIGFTKSLAQEVASRNITVNAVSPGFIETAMTAKLSEAVKEGLLEKIPLGRIGSDRDVAYGVRFLASDEASYITGQVLNINGGLYM